MPEAERITHLFVLIESAGNGGGTTSALVELSVDLLRQHGASGDPVWQQEFDAMIDFAASRGLGLPRPSAGPGTRRTPPLTRGLAGWVRMVPSERPLERRSPEGPPAAWRGLPTHSCSLEYYRCSI